MAMSIFALIPARGGSKGIPRKNIKELCGKPLIAWSIEAAQKASSVDQIVVSTDNEEIADIARSYGAEVPFLRPAELAQDDTPGIATVHHALEQFTAVKQLLLLQPTSPLRSAEDIDGIVKMFQKHKNQSAVSICESPKHPNWMLNFGEDGTLSRFMDAPIATRRQDLPKIYVANGALYLANSEWLRHACNFVSPETIGYLMPPERSADIDTPLDWEWIEFLMKKKV